MKKLLATIITLSVTVFSPLSGAATDQDIQEAVDAYVHLNGPLDDDEMFIYDENYVEPLQVVKAPPRVRVPIKYLEFRKENEFCRNVATFSRKHRTKDYVSNLCYSKLRYDVPTADIFVHGRWKQGYHFETYREEHFCSALSYELPYGESTNAFMSSCYNAFARLPHYYN